MVSAFSKSTFVLLFLGMRSVAAVSATTMGPSTVCVTTVPTCSSSPVKDPSFELNDGSWTFNGGSIIAATSQFPARSYTHLSQFAFSGLGGDEIISSFAQPLTSLCVGSSYTYSGYYSVPLTPDGDVTCAIITLMGGAQVGFTELDMENQIYAQFTGTFEATTASAELTFGIDCHYGPTGEGVIFVDIDDISIDLTTPSQSVSCSTITPTPPPIPSTSAAATTSSAPTPSSTCPSLSALICGVNSYARTSAYFIGSTFTSTYANCQSLCLTDSTCGGFFYSSTLNDCQRFTGTAAESDSTVPESTFLIYDIGCFCTEPTTTVVSSSAVQSSSVSSAEIFTSDSSSAAQSSSLTSTFTDVSSSTPVSSSQFPSSTLPASSTIPPSPLNGTSTIFSSPLLPSSRPGSNSTSIYANTTSISSPGSTSSVAYLNSTISISSSPSTSTISAGTSLSYANFTTSHRRHSGTFSRVTKTSCHTVSKSTAVSNTTIGISTSQSYVNATSSLSVGTVSSGSIVTGLPSSSLSSVGVGLQLPTSTGSSSFIESTTSTFAVGVGSQLPTSTASLSIIQPTTSMIFSTETPLSAGFTASTIYATSVETVTHCPASITDCPMGQVVTRTIAISTTICPIVEAESSAIRSATPTAASSLTSRNVKVPGASETPLPEGYTTSTVYTTQLETVKSCPATITNCPVGQVITKTSVLYTTICPIAEAEASATKAAASVTGSGVPLGSVPVPLALSTLPGLNLSPSITASASSAAQVVGTLPGLNVASSATASAPLISASGSSSVAGVPSSGINSAPLVSGSPSAGLGSSGLSALPIATAASSAGSLVPSAVMGASIVASLSTPASGAESTSLIPTLATIPAEASISAISSVGSTSTKATGESVSISSVGGSATTSSALAQFTANAAGKEQVRWTGMGIILAAAGLMVL